MTLQSKINEVLTLCKYFYEEGYSPIDIFESELEKCGALISSATSLLESFHRKDDILGLFMETHYCINLFFAHLVLCLNSELDDDIKSQALDIVFRYSRTPLSDKISKQETEWLAQNGYTKL